MPLTSQPTTSLTVALDAVARRLAARLVPVVAAGYTAPPRRPYVGGAVIAPEVVDVAYVLSGAVQVGLNRWTLPSSTRPAPSLFLPRQGDGIEASPVDVRDDDLVRAEQLSDALHVPVAMILSCAAATGLAMLSGDKVVAGPFEV